MAMLSETPNIYPFLWCNGNAEQAAQFYCSTFPNSRILKETRSPVDTPGGASGGILTVSFELDGQYLTALNAGPYHPFTPAISFVIRCQDQQEIDAYWAALLANGGKEVQCGWLTDQFGLSWQVVPANISELIRAPQAMVALMSMIKIDIAELVAAGSRTE